MCSQGRIRSVKEVILNLLYPRHCFVCGEVAPFGQMLCPDCMERLPYITAGRCRKCGKPVADTDLFCDDCREHVHSYEQGFGLFLYDDVMRDAMAGLKYKHRQEYAQPMGELLYDGARDYIDRWKSDVIVPIPLHPSRFRKRGYNQAELIARPIAEKSQIPLRTDLLLRTKETDVMKKLDPEERKRNLNHAFYCPHRLRTGVKVLLIDDIYTTGATIDAASAALKASGAASVCFLSVCIGKGFMIRY